MGTIFVDNLEPQSGTSLTLGASGDAINLASGATAGFGKIGQVFINTTSDEAAQTKLVVTPSGGSASTIAVYSRYSAKKFANQGAATVSGTTLYTVSSAVEHTFKVQIRTRNGNSVFFNTNDSSNAQLGDNSTNSMITLMEVLA